MRNRGLVAARRSGRLLPMLLCFTAGCSTPGRLTEECQIVQSATALGGGLDETSGVAASREHPGFLWTHNDSGGDAELFSVRSNGELAGRVTLLGARARDWEDLALGPCPAGTCLYVADTGDGDAKRDAIDFYRVPEPDPSLDGEVQAERFPARYPGGARDAEAMFILPSGDLFLVTKGRSEAVELYRYPMPLRPNETVTLELVVALAEGPQTLEHQVTGAAASPSGEWVAIRTYERLALYRAADLLAGLTVPALAVDLAPVGEAQGEAVDLLDNGAVVLTSEGGFPGATGSLAILRCPLREE